MYNKHFDVFVRGGANINYLLQISQAFSMFWRDNVDYSCREETHTRTTSVLCLIHLTEYNNTACSNVN